MKYYDGGPLLGRTDINGQKPEIFICTTNRSAGKTTFFGRYCVKRFLQNKEKFALLYRYQNELDNVEEKFFKDLSENFFPTYAMTSKKGSGGKYRELFLIENYKIKEEITDSDLIPCGYAMALNSAVSIKKYSHMFSDTFRIIMDEFQSEDNCYLPDEVNKFISIHTSIARGGGKMSRYVPTILIANPVSIINPYYTALGISKRLNNKTRFLRGDGWVLEQGYSQEASSAQESSLFNRAFKDVAYQAYNTQGVYLNDNLSFVQKPSGKMKYSCTLYYKGKNYHVASYPDAGYFYVGNGCDETFPVKIAMTVGDHDLNIVLINEYKWLTDHLKKMFNLGLFRFQDLDCKNVFIDLISY